MGIQKAHLVSLANGSGELIKYMHCGMRFIVLKIKTIALYSKRIGIASSIFACKIILQYDSQINGTKSSNFINKC